MGAKEKDLELKVILNAVAELVKNSKSVEEAYKRIVEVASAKGVVIGGFKEDGKKNADKKAIFKELQELLGPNDFIWKRN